MAFLIRWSPEAIEDLESITDYISRDSDYYTRSVILKFMDAVQRISEQPFIGRVLPEIGKEEIRESFVYNYRLVYQIKNNTIIVIAIIHGKRLFENIIHRFE